MQENFRGEEKGLVLMDTKKTRRIKAKLTMLGVTQAEIARNLGVSQQMVGSVIRGKSSSKRVVDELVKVGVPRHFLEDCTEGQTAAEV